MADQTPRLPEPVAAQIQALDTFRKRSGINCDFITEYREGLVALGLLTTLAESASAAFRQTGYAENGSGPRAIEAPDDDDYEDEPRPAARPRARRAQ